MVVPSIIIDTVHTVTTSVCGGLPFHLGLRSGTVSQVSLRLRWLHNGGSLVILHLHFLVFPSSEVLLVPVDEVLERFVVLLMEIEPSWFNL